MSSLEAPRAQFLPARRRARILDTVRLRGVVSIQELVDATKVSVSTVRRDLDYLTEQGYLARTHGGALVEQVGAATFEPDNSIAAQTAHAQKVAIGREAATRVAAGTSILADAGSTVLEAVRALVGRGINLTLVTNGLDTARLCSAAPAIRTLVVGGQLRPGSAVLTGEPALGFIGQLHADLCLLGAHAISGGLVTETSIEGAEIKRAMRAAARRSILLVDSSKFRHPAFCTVCEVSDLDEIITDDGIDPPTLAALRQLGIAVTIVPVEAAE